MGHVSLAKAKLLRVTKTITAHRSIHSVSLTIIRVTIFSSEFSKMSTVCAWNVLPPKLSTLEGKQESKFISYCKSNVGYTTQQPFSNLWVIFLEDIEDYQVYICQLEPRQVS